MKKIHQDNLDEKFVSRRQGFDGRLLKVMVEYRYFAQRQANHARK